MGFLCISGSPRKKGNTEHLLYRMIEQTGGELLRICDYSVEPCKSCWGCWETGRCVIKDDMTHIVIPKILKAEAIILGSPVFFNNVTAQLKAFIDRTWSIKGKLRNKIGAAVVVGRKYGAEGALTAINAFFLKHEMIIANRGISATGFEKSDVENDEESMKSVDLLSSRLLELKKLLTNE